MNNERYNQIIDEAYGNYQNYPLATIHDHRTNLLYKNRYKGWCMLNGRSMVSPHPTRHLTREEFINKCKTDLEFSEKWGLKIEETKLTFEERWDLSKKYGYRTGDAEIPSTDSIYLGLNERQEIESLWNDPVIGTNLPTKLITITYKDKTTEVYE